FRDMWHTPKEFRRGLSVWLSGHVARSEGVPKGSLGVVFGTRGALRRSSAGVSRCGVRDKWHAAEEFRRELLVWALGTRGVPGMLPGGEGDYRLGSLGRAGLSGWAQVGHWIGDRRLGWIC